MLSLSDGDARVNEAATAELQRKIGGQWEKLTNIEFLQTVLAAGLKGEQQYIDEDAVGEDGLPIMGQMGTCDEDVSVCLSSCALLNCWFLRSLRFTKLASRTG